MNTSFPRYLSGLQEINSAWLIGETFISGILRPFPGSTLITQIGTFQSPFASIYAESHFNKFGEMLLNNVSTSSPLTVNKSDGVATVSLQYNTTLQVVDN